MSLHSKLPWTKSPLVISAPMGGFAFADLAIAVSRAGGLGQIAPGLDPPSMETHLAKVAQTLDPVNGLLPVGVGLLVFGSDLDSLAPVVKTYKPAVLWLFAAKKLHDYATWTQRLREVSPDSQIWIQVGSVAAALQVAEECKPDVLCTQGADAGGHGFEKGAGLISLLPETADALTAAGHGGIHLVAAGGIADARGAAAAFALGAQGAVLGTRFLSAHETTMHPAYRAAILAAKDAGQSTVRAKLFDNLRGPNVWPDEYDGRSIVMESFVDHMNGVDIDEIRRLHKEALGSDHAGFGSEGKGRAAMWAGTGVGLVKKEQPAAEIVEEVRAGVLQILGSTRARL